MKTRLIILTFSVPLFMALAGLNGALLYFQEKSEFESALTEQALSAAITVAEFTKSMKDPESAFADSSRIRSIQSAASHMDNLDGFYLVDSGGANTALSPAASSWALDELAQPDGPIAELTMDGASANPYIIARAPVTDTSFAAVRLDAAPMVARLAERRQHIVLIVCIAGVIGAMLAWYVAARIVRDLDKNKTALAALEAGETSINDDTFSIREARELADAFRLMNASRQAAAKRLKLATAREDRERSPDSSLAAYRQAEFSPLSQKAANADVAVRLIGHAPAGCFFTLCATDDEAIVVIGECAAGAAADALSLAVAARRFLNKRLLKGDDEKWLNLARKAFNIKTLECKAWRTDEAPDPGVQLLALSDPETSRRAVRFSKADPDATAANVLDGVEALLKPTGVFAAVRRTGAAQQEQEQQQ